MLESLGLNATTERVYRAVLAQQDGSVAEIAGQLALPEADVRRALDTLAGLDLLGTSLRADSVGQFFAPGLGLANLLVRGQAELAEHTQRIEQARAAVTAISDEYRAAHNLEVAVEQLDGRQAVRDRLAELARACRSECLSFVPGGAQATAAMEASRPLDQLVLDRGARLRSLYQDSIRNDQPTLEYVRWLGTIGGETRTMPALPMPMIIVDRELVLVPLDQQDDGLGAIQVTGESVVAAFVALFELIWSIAEPFGERAVRDGRGISATERALLRLLAEGCTDQVAARTLGLSLRTVRRIMASVLHKLEARTRFEAAISAMRRGWL